MSHTQVAGTYPLVSQYLSPWNQNSRFYDFYLFFIVNPVLITMVGSYINSEFYKSQTIKNVFKFYN